LIGFLSRPAGVAAIGLATSLPILGGCGIGSSSMRDLAQVTLHQEISPRELAHRALADTQPVPTENAYARHVATARAELRAERLPTRANSTPIWVLDAEGTGGAAVRTIANEQVGIAPGADVRLVSGRIFVSDDHRSIDRSVGEGLRAIRAGTGIESSNLI